MNRVNWTAVVIFVLVVVVAFSIGVSLFGGWGYRGAGYGGWGMMGRGGMGPGMMNGWGYSPFGWFGMIFMWLVPVGLVVLVVLGGVWLARSISSSGGLSASRRTCPNCQRAVQADWRNCPYCGQSLD